MRLTAKERYGVRAMAALAAAYGQGPVALAEVADAQRIPFRYLEHIARLLRQAGLVRSWRGIAGGYELTRRPDEITVADILRALEGDVLPIECGLPETCSYSDSMESCITKPLWESLQRQVEACLTGVTLAAVAGSLGGEEVRVSDESER